MITIHNLLLMIILLPFLVLAARSTLTITSLIKEVDITDNYVHVTHKFTLYNSGNDQIESFQHPLSTHLATKLYYYYLENTKTQHIYKSTQTKDSLSFQITINPEQELKLLLSEFYYGRYELLPKRIHLLDDQLVVFRDNIQLYSPYAIENSITRYTVEKLISYSHNQNVIERGQVIEYGPYEKVPPFSKLFTELHVQNNSPLVLFKSVEKVVEVSHWGNIAVRERYELLNEGPQLIGEHSRVHYNKHSSNAGKNALREMHAQLPQKTWGVYYRDEIGNISTSATSRSQKVVEVTLSPRFGILGGWRSNFEFGYNLPTSSFLQQDGDEYLLTSNFGYSIQDILALNYTLKIIVPEGATNVSFNSSQEVEQMTSEKVFSYLDLAGRPSVVMKKQLVSGHINRPFRMRYRMESYEIYREPLMLFGAYLSFFLVVIAVRRLELVTFKLKEE